VASDGAVKKRSSPRVQLAASTSKTSSTLKHSQRSVVAGTCSTPGTGRPVRAKAVDPQTGDKSGETKDGDSSGSGTGELDRSRHWIHVTQREHHGLRQLVEFLESLETGSRHVPSQVLSADDLLSSAKVTSHLLLCLVLFI